jgi:diguanylate cyclase (GGDEF)-like protein
VAGLQGEVKYRHRSGQVHTVWMTLSHLSDGRGGVQGHVATFTDISAIDRERQALRHMAHHDPVTGLPNRRFLTSELHRCMARARRHALRMAVLFVDLDRFKWVNDNLGHEVGDLMLREMGRRLRAAVRTEDLVARWGGDEFVVVMEDVGQAANAAGVAALILAELGLGIQVGGQRVGASASIGVALFPDDAASVDELMAVADASMYRAKKAGGARVDAWHAS